MLQALGFGKNFIYSVKISFKSISTILTFNYLKYEVIHLGWFIRQGFPLAPSLFILGVEVFRYLLAHKANQGKIWGISLLCLDQQLINGHFDDDFLLKIKEDETSLATTIKFLDIFYVAFGFNVQWKKTSCYKKSKKPLP